MTAIPNLSLPLPAGPVPAGEGDAAAPAVPAQGFGAVLARLAAGGMRAEAFSGTDTPEMAVEGDEEETVATAAIPGPVPSLPPAAPTTPPAPPMVPIVQPAPPATLPAPSVAAAAVAPGSAPAVVDPVAPVALDDVTPWAPDEHPEAHPTAVAPEAMDLAPAMPPQPGAAQPMASPPQDASAALAAGGGTQVQARPASARIATGAEGKPSSRMPQDEVLAEAPDSEEIGAADPAPQHLPGASEEAAPEPSRTLLPTIPAAASPPSPPSHTAEAATPAPTTAPARPAAPESPARQLAPIAVALAVDEAKGTERLTVTLDPAELGRVEVRVERAGDAGPASIRVLAERPETLALLQRDGQELQRALDQAGIRTTPEGLSFDLGSGGNSSSTADTGGGSGEPRPGAGGGRDGGSASGGETGSGPAPPRRLTLLDIAV